MLLPLPVGRAVVFHPWDAHAPCLAAAGPEPVRKVVVKIAV
jgi:beta-galactosidase beta subunit